ncbi:general transcription factor IIH subunit 1 [Anabrus simplex]|uniref:general transcription factor IIH subunit 1 n=1 Tax=Anabrus simplex TaxID=316456 RepID=UPI0035A3D4C3
MTTSSEDVLLQVSQVRYKKGDGTLYVMNERLAWMMDNRDTVCVSHRYTDIKMQKISPEGKPKVQLQVALHDGSASTFHFVNRLGLAAQLKDRDDVKELLQQLLHKVKRLVNKELQEKNRLLSENPPLLQLYKDLVISKVITSEEFWLQQSGKYTQQEQTKKQETGVSGAFLAGIKPQTDGCNGLKYNLTFDIIECIFKTYPAVRKKHLEYVPHKLTEGQFWTKFFQSHYFHRDRIHTGTKDLFTDCAKLDDQELNNDLQAGIKDPLIDLTKFEDKSLAEEYGAGMEKSCSQSGNIVHQNMIKRFNQHSIMVLKTCQQNSVNHTSEPLKASEDSKPSESMKMTENLKSTNNLNISNSSNHNNFMNDNLRSEESLQPKTKKARISEKIRIEDLDTCNNGKDANSSVLNLLQVERYRHGPLVKTPGENEKNKDLGTVFNRILKEAEGWCAPRPPHKPPLVSPAAAVSALGELTPGGALMTMGFQDESLIEMVPAEILREAKNLYMSLCELLRHFWSSYPPTTPELEEKATHMYSALQRFREARLEPFEERVLREIPALRAHVVTHLNQLLNSAFSKFDMWQRRRGFR